MKETSDCGLRIADCGLILAQASPDVVIKAADYASRQSDRWLFIALLIVFLLAMGMLTKWGMKQLEQRDLRINELGNELGKVREEHADQMVAQADKFAQIIAENTIAVRMNAEIFGRLKGHLEVIQPVPALKP